MCLKLYIAYCIFSRPQNCGWLDWRRSWAEVVFLSFKKARAFSEPRIPLADKKRKVSHVGLWCRTCIWTGCSIIRVTSIADCLAISFILFRQKDICVIVSTTVFEKYKKNVSLKDFQLKDVTFPAWQTVYEKCSLLRHQNFRQGFQDIESSNIKKYLQNQPFMDKNANINEPLLTMVYEILFSILSTM